MSLTSGTAGSEREEGESEQLGLGSWRLGQSWPTREKGAGPREGNGKTRPAAGMRREREIWATRGGKRKWGMGCWGEGQPKRERGVGRAGLTSFP
jgi:hypothetical protein